MAAGIKGPLLGDGLTEGRRRRDGRRVALRGHDRERHPAQTGQPHFRPHGQIPAGERDGGRGRGRGGGRGPVDGAAQVADGQTGLEADGSGQDGEGGGVLFRAPVVGLGQQLNDLVVAAADGRPPGWVAGKRRGGEVIGDRGQPGEG